MADRPSLPVLLTWSPAASRCKPHVERPGDATMIHQGHRNGGHHRGTIRPTAPPTPQETLTRGMAHHQAGQLDLAATCYHEVLRLVPQQPDAVHLLGMVAFQSGRLDE